MTDYKDLIIGGPDSRAVRRQDYVAEEVRRFDAKLPELSLERLERVKADFELDLRKSRHSSTPDDYRKKSDLTMRYIGMLKLEIERRAVAHVPLPQEKTSEHPPRGNIRNNERNPSVSARRTALRNMLRGKGNRTALEVCKYFDGQLIPLPGKWTEDPEIKTWVTAYKDTRLKPRVQKLISTDMKIVKTHGH